MATVRDGIFINYRRSDTEGYAGRLEDTMKGYFGEDRVFRDIGGIAPGEDFRQRIDEGLERAAALIVLMGPNWLSSQTGGTPRLHESDDLVAQEIKSALDMRQVVVPVLVQGATMPREEDLPDALKGLAYRNAVSISDSNWAYDTTRLAKVLAIDVKSAVERKVDWVKRAVVLLLVVPMVLTLAMFAMPDYRESAIRTIDDRSAEEGYEITERAFTILQEREGVPEETLDKIEDIKGKEIGSRSEFEGKIGVVKEPEYRAKIQRHTVIYTREDKKKDRTQIIAAVNPFCILLVVLILGVTRTWIEPSSRRGVWATIMVGCVGVFGTFFYYLKDIGEEPFAGVPSDEYFAFIATTLIMGTMLGLLALSGFRPNDSIR